MIDKVDLVFHYGGKWVLSPQLVYIKKLSQSWKEYAIDMLSYIDIYVEFIETFGFKAVKQLLVTGPSGRYFMLKDDSSIRTLQSIFSYDFRVIQLFAVDEGETPVIAPNISLINEPTVNTIDIGIGTDCESSEEEENNEPIPSDYSSEELKVFRKEKKIEKSMTD
ncbi:hypothetical protein P3S68_020941 [Capsicum galapagoense]